MSLSQKLILAGCSLVCLMMVAGCGDTGETPKPGVRRIIVLTNGNSPYWDTAAAGANEAAKDLKVGDKGYKVVVERGNFSVSAQLEKLKQYMGATDVAGVAVSITDSKNQALVKHLADLKKSGVEVITIDSDIDRSNPQARAARTAYLGTDNLKAGRELGKAAKALKQAGAQYATFVGKKSATNAIERIGGFAEGIGDAGNALESFGDDGDPLVAKKNVRDAIDRNAEINLLVGIWSYNTPAIVSTVTELGIRDKITIAGFDADPPAIKAMGEGNLDVMLVQDPFRMGYDGVRLLKAMLDKDEATLKEMLPNQGAENGDIIDTGLKIVVPNEKSRIKPDLFEEGTQYLKLEEFQAWLKKYNLQGS